MNPASNEQAEMLKALREFTPTVWESAQKFIVTETVIDLVVVTTVAVVLTVASLRAFKKADFEKGGVWMVVTISASCFSVLLWFILVISMGTCVSRIMHPEAAALEYLLGGHRE